MKFENIYKETEENMRLALLSLWTPGHHPMRPAIEELFDREPLLAEPVFQSTFGWESTPDDRWRNFLGEEVVNRLGINYTPYKHQADSWEALHEGKSIVVTSGTGSGKTECFMYPVLGDLFKEKQANGHSNAIEAIFLYPLNALMKDQKKRLSTLCEKTDLHFAVYNGDTEEYRDKEGRGTLTNEIDTRKKIRDNQHQETRPEILLTNPSMLEYILVREQDQQMLQESAGKLRWIVIDEAHSYSGSAAVELEYQIKRILAAFNTKVENVRFVCTSATIGGSEGEDSLKKFIATITGKKEEDIAVIGGNRIVKPLDEHTLTQELQTQGLPSFEKVSSLRNKINEVPGMTLQQIWDWLRPDSQFNTLEALKLIDCLCEMVFDGIPVLSLRAHFFMRTINGIYACANRKCAGANKCVPLFGHLTTYKASVCPDCGEPLLEIVQCKNCGEFVLMGRSDPEKHVISSYEKPTDNDDYFSIDITDEQQEDDEQNCAGNAEAFFLIPYNEKDFFIPIQDGNASTLDIEFVDGLAKLRVNREGNGQWVEVRKGRNNSSYCPSCGQLAEGKHLNLKHFRIPISFINQVISPVLLQESATNANEWGKYIAFTDSRQGTAISAKTFNIYVERVYARQMMVDHLVEQEQDLSLDYISGVILDEDLFNHIARDDRDNTQKAYKAALMRQLIGRKSLFDIDAESMGLISLEYPPLNRINLPNNVVDYCDRYDVEIADQDWRDFLKLSLDYFFRAGNHIQPLIKDEKNFVRESSLSTPVAPPNDNRANVTSWPTVKVNNDGRVSAHQHRLVVLLCAGLGIDSLDQLQLRLNDVRNILMDAWTNLVDYKVLTEVRDFDRGGYNNNTYYPGRPYVGCYYLDLSVNFDLPGQNNVCRVKLARNMKLCPVTNILLDTTFCGYSPLLRGKIDQHNFDRYRCAPDNDIQMPIRPRNIQEINDWLEKDDKIRNLKKNGLWSNLHKCSYLPKRAYIAAEHSAQQSKDLLDEYTEAFRNIPPKINVLHCSTTMEMGVDIGDIDVVLMDTIPPTAANYLQRVGRAGRKGQSKAIAFSLCNNTPVGLQAFANPMWALLTTNQMAKVRKSQTIIQRHINSYFFRQFVCGEGRGIMTTTSVGEFMSGICDNFIQFLETMSTNQAEEQKFHEIFDTEMPFTIGITQNVMESIRDEYNGIITELKEAKRRSKNNIPRKKAINIQIIKTESENLLKYLSVHQFIPNANMPTDVVSFDFTDQKKADRLIDLRDDIDQKKQELDDATDDDTKIEIREYLNDIYLEIEKIQRKTTANRDLRTALNEYAPGQTVVVNEKNHKSAGVLLVGEYDNSTRSKKIYHCQRCGHSEYSPNEKTNCPICNTPYRGIINKNSHFTVAYEPVGFRTDQNTTYSREEKTERNYFDIRPELLNTNWDQATNVNMCEIASSGEHGEILFYNVGNGNGFAICKRCGRTAMETTSDCTPGTIPNVVRPMHKCLWRQQLRGDYCCANNGDIARHVVFTGLHPTSYSVLRFKKNIGTDEYEYDKQLAYSLGVVLKRALAKKEGIDEGEIDFGIKEESYDIQNGKKVYILFIYDTAKGGCGYSHRLTDPVLCQEVFDMARAELEQAPCKCHEDGGACSRCLIDRSNYRNVKLLSKAKALNWLNKQKGKAVVVPPSVLEVSPDAKITYQTMKEILRQSVKDSDVKKLTLCVSDNTDDYAITDWISVRSEMGKIIKEAISIGKEIDIMVEYHPNYYSSEYDKLPFIKLNDKLPDCNVTFIKDMGEIKTALVVETDQSIRRYFINENSALSFSNEWGKNCTNIFVDSERPHFEEQEGPSFTPVPQEIIREGLTKANSFCVKNYFTEAIAPYVLKPEDVDLLSDVLKGQHVDITFSDMYVNSALASLMLVYLIKEVRDIFGFTIDTITLQLNSHKRKCTNDKFNDYTFISFNFRCAKDADEYTDRLIQKVLGIEAEHSPEDADHHRWLRIETKDGERVEIRPDHGISGGYISNSRYMNLESLSGSVNAMRGDGDVLYYVIVKRRED